MQTANFRSSDLTINHGVPQGSVLGPKWFILYMNNICNVSNILKLFVFADDTVLYAGENLQQLLDVVMIELSKLNYGLIKTNCDSIWTKSIVSVLHNNE